MPRLPSGRDPSKASKMRSKKMSVSELLKKKGIEFGDVVKVPGIKRLWKVEQIVGGSGGWVTLLDVNLTGRTLQLDTLQAVDKLKGIRERNPPIGSFRSSVRF